MRNKDFDVIKENTHIVLKEADVARYLSYNNIKLLNELQDEIEKGRASEGKNPSPRYLICNLDEPYSDKVFEAILDGEAEKRKSENA